MKKLLTFIFALTLFAPLSQAKESVYTVKNLPNVHLQNKMQYVCNPAGVLSASATAEIDQILYALEQQTGIETVVAALPSIGQVDCFDFAHQLLNEWGVGKSGKDNGLVILLVTDQRCVQFYTGYGLEGDLPDAICKRIQSKYMIPYLKNEDWNNGMIAGVQAVYTRLDGTMENDTAADEEDEFLASFFIIFLVFGGIVAFAAIYAVRLVNRCPQCKKHKLQRTGSTLISNKNGVKKENVHYKCLNCGHTLSRQQTTSNDNHRSRGGGGGGPIIGGFGGSRSSGGGFSGGSFGGGRGGGGGAGSRF